MMCEGEDVAPPNDTRVRGAGPTRKTPVRPKACQAPHPLQPIVRAAGSASPCGSRLGFPCTPVTATRLTTSVVTLDTQEAEYRFYLLAGEGASKPANAPTAAEPSATNASGIA